MVAVLEHQRRALVSGAAMVVRPHRHQSPVIELGLLRSRSFSGAFIVSVLYYAGFGAFVLNSSAGGGTAPSPQWRP